MKPLYLCLLLSCTAPASPVTSHTDTVFLFQAVHDTVYYPHMYRDSLPFIVLLHNDRYVEYYGDRDSLVIEGRQDSIIYGLTRLLYNCK